MGKVKSLSYSGGATVTAPTDLTTIGDENLIINGNFDFWQRGNAATAFTASYNYLADRFACLQNTDGTSTQARSTKVPSETDTKFPATYSLKIAVTGADASIGASQAAYIRYALEGFDYARIKNQSCVLSFWVRSSLTGTYCVAFRNNAADRSMIKTYTIDAANTWERKTITLTFNPSGGTDNFSTGIGLSILWALACGSTYQTTADAWQSGNYVATSAQANLYSSTHDFYLAQPMLHRGTAAATFCRAARTIQQEQVLCERYYEKSYSIDTVPATATGVNQTYHTDLAQSATTTNGVSIKFRVPKRTDAPAVTTYAQDGSSGNMNFYGVGPGAVEVAATVWISDANSFGVYANGTLSGLTAGHAVNVSGHWAADCEL